MADFQFKFIVVGDSGVGKTSMQYCFANGVLDKKTMPTIGIEYGSKIVDIQQKKIKILVYDTAGQEVFNSISRQYYHAAAGCLMVYDVTDKKSFDSVSKWYEEVKSRVDSHVVMALVGNKNDLNEMRVIKTQEGQEKAKEYGIQFFETSAYNFPETNQVFIYLANELLNKIESNEIDLSQEVNGIKLCKQQMEVDQQNQKKYYCC